MIFNKNELLNVTLDKHFETWMHTLNTADYVPKKYLKFIDKVIYDNIKKKFKEVDIYNLLYLELQGFKLGFWDRVKIYCSGLRPLFEKELKSREIGEQQQDKITESFLFYKKRILRKQNKGGFLLW